MHTKLIVKFCQLFVKVLSERNVKKNIQCAHNTMIYYL